MTAETAMSREDTEETEAESGDDHLAGIEDGAGCAEIWEHLSRGRRAGEGRYRAGTDDERRIEADDERQSGTDDERRTGADDD